MRPASVTSAANSPWSPASLSRHPRRRSRRILDPPTGLLPVSPQRVEDGAAPGPDLDVAVLGQLSEPPVGLGDRQRGPRCGRSGRDLTALPDRLQQFPLPLLLGDPDRPTFTKSAAEILASGLIFSTSRPKNSRPPACRHKPHLIPRPT